VENLTILNDYNNNEANIYISLDLIEKVGLNTSEANFLKFMINQQIKRGDDWIITSYDDIAQQLDVKKVTVQRWFAKFSDANILIQEGNRRPLWKVNPVLLQVGQ
jgi:hypothetical protein